MQLEKLTKVENKKLFDELKEVFGSVITDKISDINFAYESFRNKTYKAKYRDTWVQLRIPKFDNANSDHEEIVTNSFDSYLFYKDGYLIKKWFDGQDLTKIQITKKITNNIIKEIKRLQQMSIDISEFNWYQYKIEDSKYDTILKKYLNDDLVFSHNNLKRSNILVNNTGRVNIIDFENCGLNSRYADPVMVYINLGIDKDLLCKEFNLDSKKFDDYVYISKLFSKVAFDQFYTHLETPLPKISRALHPFQTKKYNYNTSFIVQKINDGFQNCLDISLINDFYFVPVHVYEDDKVIIWRWMEQNSSIAVTDIKIRAIARAVRILHSSKQEFPKAITTTKIEKLVRKVGIEELKKDFDSVFLNNIKKWIYHFKYTANCHNNLSIDSIFFSKKQSIYITQWESACKNDPMLDIANLFENMGWNEAQEKVFWKTYQCQPPKGFIKYRIVVQFMAYLSNKIKLDDDFQSRINKKRIYDLLYMLDNQS